MRILIVHLLLNLQNQHNTHSPEHAENNIQELRGEVEETLGGQGVERDASNLDHTHSHSRHHHVLSECVCVCYSVSYYTHTLVLVT